MPIELPEPENVYEYDSELSANFIKLFHLLELKMGAYLQKKKEDGIKVAAKDLYDIVDLIKNNLEKIDLNLIHQIHPAFRKELKKNI